MDDIDRANLQAEQILNLQLRARRPVTLRPAGSCHYCGELLPIVGQLFCDEDCSKDYEKEQLLRKQNGGRE